MTPIQKLRHRLRAESGQSAIELALMMPMILVFAFLIMQASLVFTMAHQASWASYAAARTHLVHYPSSSVQHGDEDQVVQSILRGDYWKAANPRWNGGQDGGTVSASIGKVPILLPMAGNWQVPTHLGENEVEVFGGDQLASETTNKMKTDNNIDDF